MKRLSMKHITLCLLCVGMTFCAVAGFSTHAAAASPEQMYEGSIKIISEQQSLASLAKISLVDAVQAALAATPGQAMKAELENENDYLVYGVEIVGADGKITDVKIDAGNGKILKVEAKAEEHSDNDKEDAHENNHDNENESTNN
jgi:hypothetical protein